MNKYFTPKNSFSINSHDKHNQRQKDEIVSEYLDNNHFDEVLVIGDSKTDKLLAEAIDAIFYLYAHAGFDFRTDGGDYRITDLRELLKEL